MKKYKNIKIKKYINNNNKNIKIKNYNNIKI